LLIDCSSRASSMTGHRERNACPLRRKRRERRERSKRKGKKGAEGHSSASCVRERGNLPTTYPCQPFYRKGRGGKGGKGGEREGRGRRMIAAGLVALKSEVKSTSGSDRRPPNLSSLFLRRKKGGEGGKKGKGRRQKRPRGDLSRTPRSLCFRHAPPARLFRKKKGRGGKEKNKKSARRRRGAQGRISLSDTYQITSSLTPSEGGEGGKREKRERGEERKGEQGKPLVANPPGDRSSPPLLLIFYCLLLQKGRGGGRGGEKGRGVDGLSVSPTLSPPSSNLFLIFFSRGKKGRGGNQDTRTARRPFSSSATFCCTTSSVEGRKKGEKRGKKEGKRKGKGGRERMRVVRHTRPDVGRASISPCSSPSLFERRGGEKKRGEGRKEEDRTRARLPRCRPISIISQREEKKEGKKKKERKRGDSRRDATAQAIEERGQGERN